MAHDNSKVGQKDMNSIFVMTHKEIAQIPKDWTITYTSVVADFCPQKADPHRIHITAGGNLINYLGELSTCTADLTTSKLMCNSILSTNGAKYMCLDIKHFYLAAPLDRYEYTNMSIPLIPQWAIKQYDLNKHIYHGCFHLEMRRAVWGLPQVQILASKLLHWCLLPLRYFECPNTPGLWKHKTSPTALTLVVDDFGVKYVDKEHVDHLIACI
jgi:hypothetical protein